MALRLARRNTGTCALPAERPSTTLLVRPELLRTIAAAAATCGDVETGGPLLGTVQRTWTGTRLDPAVSVLGTVPPGPGTDGRRSSVSLGLAGDGERAAAALRWLRATTGLDLVHLGDWHVHPSGVARPSAGDVRTAVAMHAASGAPVWLSAIAVSNRDWRVEVGADGNAARCTRDRLDAAEVRFFQVVGNGLVPLAALVEEDALPRLPPLPWHVADPVRFAAECRLLAAAGFRIGIDTPADGSPGLRVCVERDGRAPVTIHTGLRYPAVAPELRDDRGRRLVPKSPFTAERFLVDLVQEVAS